VVNKRADDENWQASNAKPAAGGTGERRSDFLTPTEVADRLLIAPATVRVWASKGLLPSITTPGGHRRFRTRDVEAFIARRSSSRSESAAPASVLVIDDDPQFARYLSQLLSLHAPAVSVNIAHDGFSAGIQCESLRPDVVTLDLQMPEMDGFEVCEMIRSRFGDRKPRIVALSGFASHENIARITAAGANACLPKTTAAEVLLRELGITPGRHA
jgi:excisionase family DNA binding protein